ncbi:Ig-like domain-containing protein [Actinokineospora auranticolor]|uniref:Lipoprotein-anchoring transpeptidase ErfK/SrfK n=1 Tax=Actinokineospora auranticolor TaxID=155976 RepID=A0A2S6GH76_9PSEU|nr:Ig-like domain-containing protein [Actinokineospora auranticolor]PPK64496.1 lipoprotein-anchoring transpeptidase ErfK/SrfK [Actinokineospora auranticolor]
MIRRGFGGRRRVYPVALLGAGLVAVLALSGCTSGETAAATSASGGGGGGKTAEAPRSQEAKLVATPAVDAKDASPAGPITMAVTDGALQAVTLTNAEGKQVKGELAADKSTWTVTEHLGYGKTYTWAGSAVGADGATKQLNGSFTTVKPKRQMGASLNTGDGKTYGIAMPIAVAFDAPVKDRVAAQKAMKVATTPETEGAWAWLDDRTAHWRPKEYYKPGTTVRVTVGIYGVDLGGGTYGSDDITSSFTIGRSQIVRADTQTHRMVVITDGTQTQDFPASMGLESDPGRVTKSGTHVVMSKHATYGMTNPKYNYENVMVPWAVRISNNGEFVHGYANSIPQQGKRNVSHGCINLSPANAKIYYDSVLPGDPVEITGSNQQLSSADGDYYDWAVSWDKWTSMSATSN